jgi:hypothetical protein
LIPLSMASARAHPSTDNAAQPAHRSLGNTSLPRPSVPARKSPKERGGGGNEPCRTPWKMSRTPPIPSKWIGRSRRNRRAVRATISYICSLFWPKLPPIAAPKKGWSFTNAEETARRSG